MKICPECDAVVGPRLAVCECGHKFAFKQGKAPKPKKTAPQLPRVEAVTENPSEVVNISSRVDLRNFIDQLQHCYKDSSRNGGTYSAFLHCKGGHVVQVQVALTMRLA